MSDQSTPYCFPHCVLLQSTNVHNIISVCTDCDMASIHIPVAVRKENPSQGFTKWLLLQAFNHVK